MDSWCDFGLCGQKLTWNLQGDVLFIEGEGFMDDYLPGNSVWAPMAWLVRSVVIGDGVSSIGDYAFSGFTNLADVSIPKSVRQIGKGIFDDCTSLKEIIIPQKNWRYSFRDGMLIDRNGCQPIWPPEKAAKVGSRFAVNENDCVFRIETGRHSFDGSFFSTGIGSFGDSDTLIEIRESERWIIDIECIYLNPTLHEPNLFLPDYRNDPDLEETLNFYCPDYEYETRMPGLVNVVRDRMEIIFSEKLADVCRFHVEGRVEYYCDGENEIVMMRVSDLTEEEYNFLR